MMYLNSNLKAGPHLRTLIAHEYTHAITFSEHVFGDYLPDRPGQEEESWLDESIAHLVENHHGYSWSNLDYRISAFLDAPERYRLVVEDYYAADLWRGHGNRGSTFLFLRWCVDQFGETLLRDLVQTNLCGVENVEVSTGQPFAELYRAWSAAVFLSQTGLATRRDEEVHSLSLRSTLGGRLLAGPRYEYLDLGGDTRRFTLTGTSTKYWVAHSAAGVGSRIRVVADPAASLQVSVRHLSSSMARLELRASRNDPTTAKNGQVSFQVQLTERTGVPVTLEHLAWERSASGSNKGSDNGSSGRVLSTDEIGQLFGSARVDGFGTLTVSDFEIQSPSYADQNLVLKVTGLDDAGRAVSAWCNLSTEDVSRPEPVQVVRGDSNVH